MGSGGGLLGGVTSALFGSPQQVATPDYSQAAQDTSAGNLRNAQLATAANRVNQSTPYGSLNYQQSTDQFGNPVWSATQSLNPALQGAVDTSLGNVASQYQNNFTGGNLPSYGINPGETYSDAIMRRLQPQQAQAKESFDVQMANQGIPVGSEAYNRAYRNFSQGQNDQLTSAIVGGMQTGLQANEQQYGQNLKNYMSPLATAQGIQGLTQQNFVNPYNQAATAGADILGAMGLTNQSQQANANAINAQNNAMMSGLFSLAGGAIGAPKGTISGLLKP